MTLPWSPTAPSAPPSPHAPCAGAEVVGSEDLIAQIQESGGSGLAFDKCIATPDMMPKCAHSWCRTHLLLAAGSTPCSSSAPYPAYLCPCHLTLIHSIKPCLPPSQAGPHRPHPGPPRPHAQPQAGHGDEQRGGGDCHDEARPC